MNRCSRCLIPDTRPDTPFIDGVCSACVTYLGRPVTDWESRLDSLKWILAESRRQHPGPYDCIVPSSGGKDSTYQAITLMELGARPLIVTASTCHLTTIGRRNIDNLARLATTIEVTPNRGVRAKLNRLGLEMVGDISWPEHASIFTTPWRIAHAMGIPLIFYGESPQNQYGGPPGTVDERMMTQLWLSEFGGLLGLRANDLAAMTSEEAMADYRTPVDTSGIEAYFLGQFIPWDSHRNAEVAQRWGMQTPLSPPASANWWNWENLDNAQTGLHDHLMYRKYGFGRGCAQISVDIRAGRVSRRDALAWVVSRDGRFPYTYAGVDWREMLAGIGMKPEELEPILQRFTNWELFAGMDDRRPILKEPG